MIADHAPHGTRCEFCLCLVRGSTDDIKVCGHNAVACVPCASREWGQVYHYHFVTQRKPIQ